MNGAVKKESDSTSKKEKRTPKKRLSKHLSGEKTHPKRTFKRFVSITKKTQSTGILVRRNEMLKPE
jgi:hypothetical protein